MEKRDFYEVLGISKGSDKKVIKKAYRNLAKKYHPDKNKEADAETKFKEVQEAYEVLGDDQKKKAYDQFGHAGTQGFGGFGGSSEPRAGGYDDISDVMNDFFGRSSGFGGFGFGGGQGRRSNAARGSDLEVGINISFEEAIFGVERTIHYKRKSPCEPCKSTGAKDGDSFQNCTQCNGSGVVRQVQNTILGQIQTQAPCPTCKGAGKTIDKKCSTCNGMGHEEKQEDFGIKVPQGIPDGVTLRFRNNGDAGANGGETGDLYINIDVAEHDTLIRRGDDIYMDKKINVVSATLGGEIEVPTVHGDLKMKVPAGTQPDKVFKLSDKAGPKFRGSGNGDQYVRVKIQIPKDLSKDQKQLWEKLQGA